MLQLIGPQLIGRRSSLRRRILISAAIGLASGFYCWFLMAHFHQGAADFNWAIWAAQDLLAHRNPYQRPMQLYPIPSAIFGLPFVWMRPEAAGGAFYGISSALMAFGLSRYGYHRLLVFLAYPYWAGLLTVQWTPLILAGAFLPPLLPAALAKPQLGLPVLLTRATRRGLLACALVLALSFLILPRWPWLWAGNFHFYARFIPLLIWPGPLLALALLRYRERDARLLLLMAIAPQRWFYDMLILWLIPKSRRELCATVFISWAAGIWRWYYFPHSFTQVGRCAVIVFYLPMLVIVLLRKKTNDDPSTVQD
jgi:hypothetical protein